MLGPRRSISLVSSAVVGDMTACCALSRDLIHREELGRSWCDYPVVRLGLAAESARAGSGMASTMAMACIIYAS